MYTYIYIHIYIYIYIICIHRWGETQKRLLAMPHLLILMPSDRRGGGRGGAVLKG